MTIRNMNDLTKEQLHQAAQMLADGIPLGWATIEEGMEEIDERLIPENTLLAAFQDDVLMGWGGILPQYDGRVFELHPLVVRADKRKKGVGRALMQALEEAARARGALSMYIGADDEAEGGETSFANVDLYDDLPKRIREFDPGTHQTGFYLKMGYKIVGVVPDANGLGKPDIMLGKRL